MEGAWEGSLLPRPWESRKMVQLPLMPGPGLGTRLPGEAQPGPQVGHHQATQGDAPLHERVWEGVKLGRGGGHGGFVSFLGHGISSCPPSLQLPSFPGGLFTAPHLTLPSFRAHLLHPHYCARHRPHVPES